MLIGCESIRFCFLLSILFSHNFDDFLSSQIIFWNVCFFSPDISLGNKYRELVSGSAPLVSSVNLFYFLGPCYLLEFMWFRLTSTNCLTKCIYFSEEIVWKNVWELASGIAGPLFSVNLFYCIWFPLVLITIICIRVILIIVYEMYGLLSRDFFRKTSGN